jgi:hypothetical protein
MSARPVILFTLQWQSSVVVGAALLVLAWPIALATIIGDQSSLSAADATDYLARPLPAELIFILGIAASTRSWRALINAAPA